METMQDFIARNELRGSAREIATRNDGLMTDAGMTHYRVTLTGPVGHMTVLFSQGSAITRKPHLEDVLACIGSDSASCDGVSFEDWADRLGFDTDSRRAERIYRACVQQTADALVLLGHSELQRLMYEVESC